MVYVADLRTKFDRAVASYFACRDDEQRKIIAHFLSAELQQLRDSEKILDDIIQGNRKKLEKEYAKYERVLLKGMLTYLATGSPTDDLFRNHTNSEA